MSPTAELDFLLGGMVDGLLDEPAVARLEALLASDAGARRRYRRFVALDAGLRWDYVAAAREPQPAAVARRRWRPLAAAAAALVLLTCGAALWSARGALPALTVVDVAGGSLTWSDDAGERRALSGGEGLSSGQLALDGASASARLRFADGSTVVLAGDSAVALAGTGQKLLRLTHGALSADVQPQPAGRPLLVRTGTAELRVLGTRFTVTTDAERTTLEVEHGRVRLERLADGQAVEVAAQQSAVAGLDPARPMLAAHRDPPPQRWSLDLAHLDAARWTGTWVAPSAASPAFLSAAPYLAARTPQGAPIVHYGVRISAPDEDGRPFVRFAAGSTLTLRYRVAHRTARTHFEVMVCTHTAAGAFGGTFSAGVDTERSPADAEGWRSVALGVAEFRPMRASQPTMVGCEAVFILPRATWAGARLEVAGVEVAGP